MKRDTDEAKDYGPALAQLVAAILCRACSRPRCHPRFAPFAVCECERKDVR